jgi:hypothetical protein
MPSVLPRLPRPPWWKLIDWRLVAAVALPLWAFMFGAILTYRPARVAAQGPPGPPPTVTPAPPDSVTPPPVVPTAPPAVVPLVVPVPVGAETPNPAGAEEPPPPQFRLPDTEVAAPDRCKTYDTKVRFHANPVEAKEEAKKARKMVFVLHLSGNLEDPGFT